MPTAKHRTSKPQNSAERRTSSRDGSRDTTPQQFEGLLALVSFRARHLEPWIAGTLAVYTFCASVILSTSEGSAWLIATLAASVCFWGRKFPAKFQWILLLRATLLLAGAMALNFSTQAGGPAGVYFFWPCVIAMFYAFLLAQPWSSLLAAVTAVTFVLALKLVDAPVVWAQALMNGVFLSLSAALAIVFGQTLRAADRNTESSLRDARTLLYNEEGFFTHGASLLRDCRKHGRPFSMVLVSGTDLREITELLGRRAANELFIQLTKVVGAIPGKVIAARIEGAEFALLMPELDSAAAKAVVSQWLGTPAKAQVKINGKLVTVVLEIVCGQIQDNEHELEDLYGALHGELSKLLSPVKVKTQTTKFDLEIPDAPNERRAGAPTVPMELSTSKKMTVH